VLRRGSSALSGAVRDDHVFSDLAVAHHPDLSRRHRVFHRRHGRVLRRGRQFHRSPALRAVGLDWNFAVGTDLAHIVGKSVVAAKRHRALGNVDLRLGFIMAIGTMVAQKSGAANSNVKTRGQREPRRQRRLDRNLREHFQLHDLGGLENTPLAEKTQASLKSAGNGAKTG